jgi:hypothetical protein
MKEDFKSLIENEFDKIDTSKENTKELENDIQELINNQNKHVQEEIIYRRKLFDILEKIEKMGIKITYNDKMTTQELEKILKEVKL